MEILTKSRGHQKSSITRAMNWFKENKGKEENIHSFKLRKETIQSSLSKYIDLQNQIEDLDEDKTDKENREEIENNCYELLSGFESEIDRLYARLTTPVQPTVMPVQQTLSSFQQKVKLPEISIPSFCGDISKWTSFIELFDALINKDSNMSNIQKFMYLKTYLKGEPLKLIEALELTNSNYEIALDILKHRYENKLSIINNHINFILDYPNLTKCTAPSLRDLITNCQRNLQALKVLKCRVDEWDLLLVNILVRKLDYGSKRSYEEDRDRENLPTLDEFFDIIEKRCNVLENLNPAESSSRHSSRTPRHTFNKTSLVTTNPSSSSQSNPARVNNSLKRKVFCAFCNGTNHRIYTCHGFKGLTHLERSQFVTTKRLCFNCLGSKHNSSECSSQGCSLCTRKHHSLLHTDVNTPSHIPENRGLGRNQSHHANHSRVFQISSQLAPLSTQPQPQPPPMPQYAHTSRNGCVSQTNGQNTETGSSQIPQETNYPSSNPNSLSVSVLSLETTQVLLATATITLYSKWNDPIQARILFDTGSQTSFITENLVKRLHCDTYKINLNILGISKGKTMSNEMTDIIINSKLDNSSFKVSCAILENITCQLPQVPINLKDLNIPIDIQLADPLFFNPSDIDILVNASVYSDMLCDGLIRLGKNLPVLQKTHLGYVVMGNVPPYLNKRSQENISLSLIALTQSENLDKLLTRFWTIEEIPKKILLSPEDELAEKKFSTSLKILRNGAYQVDLPLRTPDEHLKLGDSFFIAQKRFFNLEKRFRKDPSLFIEYKRFIHEYLALNHGQYIPLALTNEQGDNKYFMPHHCVIKESSTSTKLRVVFDASCKTTSGHSLNDICLKGFQVQPELFDILCRFRLSRFVITADIEKMYRQIKINPQHAFLQNILWRDSPEEALKCIQLNTVTYGTNSAPFLACRTLKEIALSNQTIYPLAADAILNHTYMDDILYSCNTLDDIEKSYHELKELLGSAQFHLHKWCSNSNQFSEKHCPNSDVQGKLIKIDNTPNNILGLSWRPISDYLSISVPDVQFPIDSPITKRKVLSTLAQMFDPLGLINPIIVVGKIFMQKLWLEKLDWDTPLNKPLRDEWLKFVNNLITLNKLRIYRHLFLAKTIVDCQLHGFSDASLKAYGACIFLKASYSDGTVSCNLVTSKSRIAPVKIVTLPRLELCAMLLLSKLIERLMSVLDKKITLTSVNLWSDSEVSLAWIKSHASRWHIFVSNRVSQIQELTADFHWRYIKSSDNPADLLSRGIVTPDIINMNLWWHGPTFLQCPDLDLSTFDKKWVLGDLPEERKVTLKSVDTTADEFQIFWADLFNRFSNFSRLQRTLAYCQRFIKIIKKRRLNSDEPLGPLTVEELQVSKFKIVKILQKIGFSKEINELETNKLLSNKNILSLNPFINQKGFLCVGGRLRNADIPEGQKYPILLPSKNQVVALLLKLEHIRLGHAGAQTVLSNIRLEFWPLNGLREIKKIIRNCTNCFRFRAQPAQQMMAELPQNRVSISHPFQNTGVDFAGPFFIKSSPLRKAPIIKVYIALFICLATKAVHLECVSSLSTEHFMLTLKRFISRRGNPTCILSDNATNFLGAKNELKDIYNFFKNQANYNSIKTFLSQTQIMWKFIPPRSPHWGGIWESNIKIAKYHLKRIVGNTNLTFEQFSTVLTQIEAILNSRPLCALSNDPSDLSSLTPGHFLIGRSLTAYPERNIIEVPENRLKFWQLCTKLQQQFWKRWTTEYLNKLQNRPKWLQSSKNLEVNELVLVKEDNITPLKWPLARIVEIIPGPDGRVRLVRIRTSNGNFLRSISKICPLFNNKGTC